MNPSVEPLFPTTVLVTGGAGFIGSALVRYLMSDTSVRVVNLDKLTYAACLASLPGIDGDPRYTFVKGDVADESVVRQVFEAHRPDYVMHLAAESHVDRSIEGPGAFVRTNIHGTFTLLQVALRYLDRIDAERADRFRFLHVSTDEVYGSLGPTGRFTEDSPVRPSSPYSASKAAADHLVNAWHRTYGLPTIITNCSNNYGPYQFPEKLIPLMILRAMEGRSLPIYGSGQQVRDWLHVEDHARALWLAATRGTPGRDYLVGGEAERTNLEVVHGICALLDANPATASGAPHGDLVEHVQDRPGHDQRYAIDPSRIRDELGFEPEHDFESGLAQTVAWYLSRADWWGPLKERYEGERLGLVE